jgi:hypothetical protein
VEALEQARRREKDGKNQQSTWGEIMEGFVAPAWMTRKPIGDWGKTTGALGMTAEQVAKCAADPDFQTPEDVFDDRSQYEDDKLFDELFADGCEDSEEADPEDED